VGGDRTRGDQLNNSWGWTDRGVAVEEVELRVEEELPGIDHDVEDALRVFAPPPEHEMTAIGAELVPNCRTFDPDRPRVNRH
jgi:hypothetical protein